MAVTTISGRFLDTENVPIAKRGIEIYTIEGCFPQKKDLVVKTDQLGNFTFQLNASKSVKCYQLSLKGEDNQGPLFDRVFTINPGQFQVDLKTEKVAFFATKDGIPLEAQGTNRIGILDPANTDFYTELAKNATVPKFKEIFATHNPFITTEQVQSLFGTEKLELNDENVVDMLFNGIFPAIPREGKVKGDLVFLINWSGFEKDGSADIPDAEITLHQVEGKYRIKEAAIRYENEPWLRKTAKEGEDYNRILHLATSMASVQGEAIHHLGIGHLIVGLYAQSFLRFIQNNPIRNLLKAHLNVATLRINQLGEDLIFGNGVLNLSGLSAKGIESVIAHHLAHVDYTYYKPRKPLNGQHTFAQALNLYWTKVVKPVVEEFFNENREEIVANWNEIFQMSQKLVNKSVDYIDAPDEDLAFVDNHEIDLNPFGRKEIKGSLKSIRPITEKESDPSEEDIERLKQWCCHAIQLSTLWHTQLHNSQRKFVSDLEFATLAPQNRGLNAEGQSDPYLNTLPADAAKQLSVVSTLVNFQAPKLLDDSTVWPPLQVRLKQERVAFKEIGFDVDAIMSTVAI